MIPEAPMIHPEEVQFRALLKRQTIYSEITVERHRQDAQWGTDDFQNPFVNLACLTEEVGEVANALLEKNPDGLKLELIQVAAVCVKWLERLDERTRY